MAATLCIRRFARGGAIAALMALGSCGYSTSRLPVADVWVRVPGIDIRSSARDALRKFSSVRGYKFVDDVRYKDSDVLLQAQDSLKLDFAIQFTGSTARATVYCWDRSANWRAEVTQLKTHLELVFPGRASIENERPEHCTTAEWRFWKLLG